VCLLVVAGGGAGAAISISRKNILKMLKNEQKWMRMSEMGKMGGNSHFHPAALQPFSKQSGGFSLCCCQRTFVLGRLSPSWLK